MTRRMVTGSAVALLGAIVLCGADTVAGQDTASGAPGTVRDGSHDFDFIYGKWRMPNHRLKERLAGSHEWADFITCDEGGPLPGGIGNTDFWRANYWKDFVGVTVRTYDRATGLWRIYWVDNTFSKGVMDKPVIGKFDGSVGTFQGADTFNGKPVIVRFIWTLSPAQSQTQWEKTLNPSGARVVAKWEQAFSADGGKTWETNWYNEFIQDDHCSPTS
jgi:hypothetical protein